MQQRSTKNRPSCWDKPSAVTRNRARSSLSHLRSLLRRRDLLLRAALQRETNSGSRPLLRRLPRHRPAIRGVRLRSGGMQQQQGGGGGGRRGEPGPLTRAVDKVFHFVRLAEFEILFVLFFLITFLLFKDLMSQPQYNQIFVKKPDLDDRWP